MDCSQADRGEREVVLKLPALTSWLAERFDAHPDLQTPMRWRVDGPSRGVIDVVGEPRPLLVHHLLHWRLNRKWGLRVLLRARNCTETLSGEASELDRIECRLYLRLLAGLIHHAHYWIEDEIV